ncbi:hypothetical protein, partial [Xylella fastidiosa]|uniref:hypothetical protein n=1 Tax=Xylella fastidiosa TaxID=2371 RepID=UPI00138A2A31
IAAKVSRDGASLDRWRVAVEAWVGRGNRYTNVDGMVEWYRDGVPAQPARARGASPQSTRTPAYETVRAGAGPKKEIPDAATRARIL